MTVKKYGLTGISASVEFGKNGLRIKDNGASLEARTNDEATLAEFLVAQGTSSNAAVNKAQLDAKQNTLTVAAGSANYLDITGDEISVHHLLVSDVTVDVTHADLAAFLAAEYTSGDEFQEGDIIILTAATDSQQRTWIHNGGSAHSAADFTRLQVDLTESVIRAMFSAGSGISYDAGTGVISLDADASDISTDDTGFVAVTGASVQVMLQSIDGIVNGLRNDVNSLQTLSGRGDAATHLGTFTGNTISDNVTIKTALQSLETKVETVEDSVMSHCRKLAFDYQSGASFNIGDVIMSGKYVKETTVKITTPFNDIAANLQIGKSGDTDLLMNTSQNDLQDAGVYGMTNFEVLDANTQFLATLDAGTSTQGAGYILIEYC